MPACHRPESEIPFAHEAGDRRHADHAQCTDGEGQCGARHTLADAIHFTHPVHTQGLRVVARGEEQGDFHDTLVDQMHDAADGGERPKMAVPRAM